MRRIFWDTMVHAYWLEGNRQFGQTVEEIHGRMQQRGDLLCSSLFVLNELMVGPVKTGDLAGADLIERYFHSSAIDLLSYPDHAVRIFADLRANQGLKSLDALHLATAGAAGVDIFLTNDRRLQRAVAPGVSMILPLDSGLI